MHLPMLAFYPYADYCSAKWASGRGSGMRSQGTITKQDREFVETWENVSTSGNGIIRINARGEEIQEIIRGNRRFMLTSEERIILQDKIRREADDPFLNGCFRPIVVPDTITVESNPNAINDEEIAKILVASDLAWEEWLTTIDSPQTLNRMLTVASTTEGITLKRYREIEQRLNEVKPRTRIIQKDAEQFATMSTPGSPGGSLGGGRSSDYR